MQTKLFCQFEKMLELEAKLGNPRINGKLFSFDTFLGLDEKSEFPSAQADYLNSLGLQTYYLPIELGGSLSSFEELGYLFRSIYRRDITLGLGYGVTTFMAAVHIFLAGSPKLKSKLSKLILNGHTISVAYHEKEHGNDLLNNRAFAKQVSSHSYELTGVKWVINNATTSKALTTFVRTSPTCGPRGFSLFFIDKDELPFNQFTYLPKIKTHGVKGCRIGGIHFQQALINEAAIIGKLGEGFELTIKAFQITRAVLPSMALGASDTALRLCWQFANERQLYGQPILDIPHVKETLVEAFINILASDCLSIAATRALHYLPEQMSVVSAIAKFQIPKLLSVNLKNLSIIMGSRFYMREEPYGIFQKIMRDFPIVSLGHSSDVICLNTILPQLKFLLAQSNYSQHGLNDIKNIFSLKTPVPPFQSHRLKISNNGFNDIFNTLFSLKNLISVTDNNVDAATYQVLQNTLDYCLNLSEEIKHRSKSFKYQLKDFDVDTYQLGEMYCKLFTIICCYLVWIYNLNQISNYFDSGVWIIPIAKSLLPDHLVSKEIQQTIYQKTFNYLSDLYSKNLFFGIVPITYQ